MNPINVVLFFIFQIINITYLNIYHILSGFLMYAIIGIWTTIQLEQKLFLIVFDWFEYFKWAMASLLCGLFWSSVVSGWHFSFH